MIKIISKKQFFDLKCASFVTECVVKIIVVNFLPGNVRPTAVQVTRSPYNSAWTSKAMGAFMREVAKKRVRSLSSQRWALRDVRGDQVDGRRQ